MRWRESTIFFVTSISLTKNWILKERTSVSKVQLNVILEWMYFPSLCLGDYYGSSGTICVRSFSPNKIKSYLVHCSLEIRLECSKFLEMRCAGVERTSCEVIQYEPDTILTQGHQQKYYTDMYRATRQHRVINLVWEREGSTTNVQIPLLV